MLLHGFQQRGLCLRRCTVDFVRQNQVGKNRTGLKAENGIALLILGDDVGTRHVGGHQVRGELNPGERKVENTAERSHKAGLSDAGHTLQQNVTSGDERNDGVFNNLGLTDHILAGFLKNPAALYAELLDALFCNHCFVSLS